MKVFVTGGNGFIGSRVVHRLHADGHELRLLLRQTSKTHRLEGIRLSSHVLHRLMEESPGLASMLRQTAQDRVPTTVSPQPGEKTNG